MCMTAFAQWSINQILISEMALSKTSVDSDISRIQ